MAAERDRNALSLYGDEAFRDSGRGNTVQTLDSFTAATALQPNSANLRGDMRLELARRSPTYRSASGLGPRSQRSSSAPSHDSGRGNTMQTRRGKRNSRKDVQAGGKRGRLRPRLCSGILSRDAVTLRSKICSQLPNQEMIFEYMKACYGTLVQPQFARDFNITCDALLKVVGQGAVYVHLNCNFPLGASSSNSLSVPPAEHTVELVSNTESPVVNLKQSDDASTMAVQLQTTGADCLNKDEIIHLDAESHKVLTLHRSNTHKELLEAYLCEDIMKSSIKVKMINDHGNEEKGEGADVLINDSIHITFTTLTGLVRRPIFHTCGSVMELPSTYDDYCDFRKEFSELVTQQDIDMDLI
eukprot:gene1564-1724_t